MSYAVDTNVLARSIEADHPMQNQALGALQALLGAGETICVLSQNLYEFWVVATRPLEQNGLGLSASEAQSCLSQFESVFRLRADSPGVYVEWKQLVSGIQ